MKQMVKKALTFVLVICMAVSLTAYASDDADTLTLKAEFNIEDNELIISGEIQTNKGNTPVVMMVTLEDVLIDAQQIAAEAPVDGVASFSFDGLHFGNLTPSGDYNVYVSAGSIGGEEEIVYSYVGIDKRFKLLTDVNKAITEKNNVDLITALSNNRSLVCSGDDDLFGLGEQAQKKFAALMIDKGVYPAPDDYDSNEDVEKIESSLSTMAEDYTEILTIASACDIKDEATLDAWLEKYAESTGFFAENEETEYSEKTLGKYFESVKSESELYERLTSVVSDAEDFDELRDNMLIAGILAFLEEANYVKIEEATMALIELFTVDMDAFEDLTSDKRVAVYQSLIDASYDSVKEYINAFDNAVEEQASKKATSSGSFGGSGGGGGRGIGSVTKANVPVIPAIGSGTEVSVGGFNDLEGFEWAQDAIRHLSSQKVISGRGNGSFDPMAQVNRAEFVKMLVEAFDIPKASYNDNFEDVPQDSWYAEYVAAASNIGVVTGIDATHFAPDAPISRQDMIVLLYRAAGFSASPNEKDVFTDSYAISDYAKSAVYALYEKGMVLGDGNGILEPLRSASRAEAAQMIYNIIK